MNRIDFRHGKILTNILQTAFPMLIAQIINLLYNIVDRIYIGRIPGTGTAALGAVGLCFPMVILITGFTNMFGMGGSPLFSMELGRGNRKKAGEIQNTAFRLLLIISLIIMLAGELFAPQLLFIFGSTRDELTFALPYLRIFLLGSSFSMICAGMNPFINAQGYASYGMLAVAAGAAANILLDPLFIFTLGMGVSGAAIATVISQGLSCLLSVRFFRGKRNEFPLLFMRRPVDPAGRGIRGRLFPWAGEIAGLGTAAFIMQVTNLLVSIACNNMLMRYGGALWVSVMTIINSVRQIVETPVLAVAEGASPVLSYNYGAGRPERVRRAIGIMTAMCVSYTVIAWLLIEAFPGAFISVFSKDAALRTDAVHALHLYFLAFIFQSLQYSAQSTFKALNKKKRAIFFSLFRKAIMVVPLTILLPSVFRLGTDGVFIAEPISNLIGGLASFLTMLFTILPELKRMRPSGKA